MPTYKVTIHTSYEEIYEVEYDGSPDDFYDDPDCGDKYTRLTPTDVTKLSAHGSIGVDVEELG